MRLTTLNLGLAAAAVVIWVGLCGLQPNDDLAALEEFITTDTTRLHRWQPLCTGYGAKHLPLRPLIQCFEGANIKDLASHRHQ